MKQIELPITITEIPVLCFNGCTSLSSITLPETLTKIEDKILSVIKAEDVEQYGVVVIEFNKQ